MIHPKIVTVMELEMYINEPQAISFTTAVPASYPSFCVKLGQE